MYLGLTTLGALGYMIYSLINNLKVIWSYSKITFPPPNTEALWIDLSVKPIVLKIFHTDGWTPVSDPSGIAKDVKLALQEALKEVQKL